MKQKRCGGPRPDLNECKTFEFLHQNLVVLGKSKKQLANELGVSQATMNTWTKRYNFGVNFHSHSHLGKHKAPHTEQTKRILSKKIKIQYLKGRRPANYKGRENRVCEICGSEFKVICLSDNDKQRHKTTCSRVCANKKHAHYMQFERPKVEKIQHTCVQCGTTFETWPSLAQIRFCSYECATAARRGKKLEEQYGVEKAQKIKEKIAKARSQQSTIVATRPVLVLVNALIPLLGNPSIEYQIGSYTVDLCYPQLKAVIEVDGNYWHDFPFGLERDHKKTGILRGLGWKVLRFWESEILADPSKIATQIEESVNHD